MELATLAASPVGAGLLASEETGSADPDERRISRRRRVLKGALIVFGNRYCTLRCYILNLSETGAQLMMGDILQCPSEFMLKPEIGPERHCELVWRKGDRVGVRFV